MLLLGLGKPAVDLGKLRLPLGSGESEVSRHPVNLAL